MKKRKKKLGCLLRIDNVLKPGTFNTFKQIMQVINKEKIISIIDVTPKWHGKECDDKEYLKFVKKQLNKGHVLALHGVEHKCRVLTDEEHKVSWLPSEDEFDCKDYRMIYGKDIPVKIQKKWLKEGKQLLKKLLDQETNLLMPPAHAYNNNTLKAMMQEEFIAISDYGRWDAGPYTKENIIVLPFDFEDYMKNTREDGSNIDAMMEMFQRYYKAAVRQRGYYATFIHCDFSGDGNVSLARLQALKKMITFVKNDNNKFVNPQKIINNFE